MPTYLLTNMCEHVLKNLPTKLLVWATTRDITIVVAQYRLVVTYNNCIPGSMSWPEAKGAKRRLLINDNNKAPLQLEHRGLTTIVRYAVERCLLT